MHQSIEDLEIPKSNIVIPSAIVKELIDRTEITREALAAKLPINLGRGVPTQGNVNRLLIAKAYKSYATRVPNGFPTYAGEKFPGSLDSNAFRGDGEYILHVLDSLNEEFGLQLSHKNILTGSSGGARPPDRNTRLLPLRQRPEARNNRTNL